MAFQWFKLKVCQPSLLPSKFSINKNFPCEVKVYQNLVLFAFCFFKQEDFGQIFLGQYPDDRVEKENVSIFVD